MLENMVIPSIEHKDSFAVIAEKHLLSMERDLRILMISKRTSSNDMYVMACEYCKFVDNTAYHQVHSMNGQSDFMEKKRYNPQRANTVILYHR